MEYGWNRVLPQFENDDADVYSDDKADAISTRSARSIFSKQSVQGSLKDMTRRLPSSPYTDRTFINEWKPPLPSTIPSNNDEETQLEAMEKQVASLNHELEVHQSLQAPMMDLVGLSISSICYSYI